MARYIDVDLLIENIVRIRDLRTLSTRTIGEAINATPTADVVETVRCKDCKFHKKPSCPMLMALNWTDDNDFCSYGERRTDDDL